MSSTPTTRNGFDKQAYGDNPDLWGIQNLNTDLDLIDESLDGVTAISTTGGSTTLNATNFATNQARKRFLIVTGVLTSGATLIIPNVEKWYRVVNAATGAFTLTINTAAGTGCVVTQGCTWDVHCDGVGAGTLSINTMPVNNLPLASAALNMNSNKITGLTQGAAPGEAATFDQLPGPAPDEGALSLTAGVYGL